jgi:choline dehydrogenase-like flavoprotein
MGTDPQTSVVDPDLRAHDVPNLYLVGSGCFVTASASPPTLTIAALAIRAAEHIAGRLRSASPTPPGRTDTLTPPASRSILAEPRVGPRA